MAQIAVPVCDHAVRPLDIYLQQVSEYQVGVYCKKCGAELKMLPV